MSTFSVGGDGRLLKALIEDAIRIFKLDLDRDFAAVFGDVFRYGRQIDRCIVSKSETRFLMLGGRESRHYELPHDYDRAMREIGLRFGQPYRKCPEPVVAKPIPQSSSPGKGCIFMVTVPEPTDRVYLAGNFNDWNPAATQMEYIGGNEYRVTLSVKADLSVIWYKYCRGTWDTVEKDSEGQELKNRVFYPGGSGSGRPRKDRVAAWADSRRSSLEVERKAEGRGASGLQCSECGKTCGRPVRSSDALDGRARQRFANSAGRCPKCQRVICGACGMRHDHRCPECSVDLLTVK